MRMVCCWWLALACWFAGLAGADVPDTVARVKSSIVGVGTLLATRTPPAQLLATGFAVGDGTLIVTSAHALPAILDSERYERLVVMVGVGPGPDMRSATVLAKDDKHDVALLRIAGPPLPTLRLGDAGRVREGDGLLFTGFPIGAVLGFYPVTHRAMVSSLTPIAVPVDNSKALTPAMLQRLNEPYNVFQLDATAYPGNSGGPLYWPDSAEVVGMLNMVFVKETKENVLEKPSGISYAMPIVYAKRLLEKMLAASAGGGLGR